jgi:hypothetical protein
LPIVHATPVAGSTAFAATTAPAATAVPPHDEAAPAGEPIGVRGVRSVVPHQQSDSATQIADGEDPGRKRH